MVKAYSKINSPKYDSIAVSVSGGADSDDVLDIIERVRKENTKIIYMFFDTGLEYQATKNHLDYLKNKYNIEIQSYRAKKPIPICCKEYGQPFMSKLTSEFIQRLQRHDFKWEDAPYDELIKKYPKCKSAIEWWTGSKGTDSRFNIQRNKWLKEFMILNPPQFKISNKCCEYAKKSVAHKAKKEVSAGLSVTGIRKAEGGVRAAAYKNCFTEKCDIDEYRPIFWYSNKDKEEYEEHYNIKHSNCYTEYGLKRTGCAGCPFGKDFEFELKVIEKYEPKLFKAVNNIFGDSYEYTRKYYKFCEEMDAKYGSYKKYLEDK